MGAPYMPRALSPDGLVGASSFSSVSAWVCLGLLLGIWLSSHPSVRRLGGVSMKATAAFATIGFVSSLSLCLMSWVHTLSVSPLIDAAVDGAVPLQALAYGNSLFVATGRVLEWAPGVALLCSVACGLMLPVMADAKREAPPLSGAGMFAVAAVFALLGLLQPLAWSALLPHSSFPIPLVYARPDGAPVGWELPVPLATLPTALSFGVVRLVLRGTKDRPRPMEVALVELASLCVGCLAFRAMARIAPSLYGATAPMAYGSLVIYLLVYGAACVIATGKMRLGESRTDPLVTLGRTITKQGWGYLAARGLTRREILVLCSALKGLSSTEAATIIGVKGSTVREYRRRGAAKLGVISIEDAADVLPDGCLSAYGRAAGPLLSARIAMTGILCLAVLMLLPFGDAVRTWADVWAYPMGAGLGLALAWLASILAEERHQWGLAILATIMLLCSCAALVFVRLGMLPFEDGHAPYKLTALMSSAGVAFGTAHLLSCLSPATGQSAQSAFSVAPALSIAGAALLSSLAGMAAWCVFVSTALLAVVVGMVVLLVRRRLTVPIRSGQDEVPTLRSLAAASLVAWCWGETWRDQGFESLMPILSMVSALMLVVSLLRSASVVRSFRTGMLAGCVASLCAAHSLGSGGGLAVLWLLWIAMPRDSGEVGHTRVFKESAAPRWFSYTLTAGVGLVCGPLVTNAYGFLLLHPDILGVENGLRASVALLVMVTATCLVVTHLLGQKNVTDFVPLRKTAGSR